VTYQANDIVIILVLLRFTSVFLINFDAACRMKAADIKQMSHENDKTPLDQVADVLLYIDELADMQSRNEQEKYKISYKRIEGQLIGGVHDATSTTSVKASILKTCFNNLVRPVWEGPAINVQHASYNDLPSFVQNALPDPSNEVDTAYASSGLAFPLMLGNTISKLQNEAAALHKQKQQLAVDALRWKDTLDKLMDKWQDEKHELTQNFLTLFNQHKARHIETRQKLEALTKHGDDEAVVRTLSNKKLKRSEREAVPDDEDQHDYATWDPDMVDRLAAGPEGRRKMAKQNNDVKVKCEDDEFKQLGNVSYKNPITGVMMVTDHKQLFSDDEGDDVPSAKKRR
jgi:hypothetical protein